MNLEAQVIQVGNKEIHILFNNDGMPVSPDQLEGYKKSIGIKKKTEDVAMVKFNGRMVNLARLKLDDKERGRAFTCSKFQLTSEEIDELLKQKSSK